MAPSRMSPTPSSITDTAKYGDFRDDLFRDGYVVVKGAIPKDKAKAYQNSALEWLEGFNLGFDRNDKSTWKKENLPQSWKGGMYLHFSAAHEKYMWDARLEPGVTSPFAKIWGTDELLVSFDTVNITLPQSVVGEYDSKPWPHCDQAPERKKLACVQGIINLSEAGPDDGGLVVLKGSSVLFNKFFDEHEATNMPAEHRAKHKDFYPFNEDNMKWYVDHGCELIKVCAEPGDLILWDSRCVHYAKFGTSELIRTIIYAAYTPAEWCLPEDLEKKQEMFKKFHTTTHWPHANFHHHGAATITVDGKEILDPLDRSEPVMKPEHSEELLKLAGIVSY